MFESKYLALTFLFRVFWVSLLPCFSLQFGAHYLAAPCFTALSVGFTLLFLSRGLLVALRGFFGVSPRHRSLTRVFMAHVRKVRSLNKSLTALICAQPAFGLPYLPHFYPHGAPPFDTLSFYSWRGLLGIDLRSPEGPRLRGE